MATPFVPLGRIVKTHGLAGEVAVAPATDLPFVLPEGLKVWFVPPPTVGARSARVVSVRRGPKGPLLALDTVSDIDAASLLCGRELLAREEDLPDAWHEVTDEFDPVGLTVRDEAHGVLGEVTEVIVTGANDVWVVDGPLGEVLLPVIDEVVLDVDDHARTADVRLLPGLLPDSEDER